MDFIVSEDCNLLTLTVYTVRMFQVVKATAMHVPFASGNIPSQRLVSIGMCTDRYYTMAFRLAFKLANSMSLISGTFP
jgi:hypothetical protein